MPPRKRNPGDPFSLGASEWNRVVERVNEPPDTRRPGRGRLPTTVRVRNDTGSDLPRWGIIGLDEILIAPDDSNAGFLAKPAFKGKTPDSEKQLCPLRRLPRTGCQ